VPRSSMLLTFAFPCMCHSRNLKTPWTSDSAHRFERRRSSHHSCSERRQPTFVFSKNKECKNVTQCSFETRRDFLRTALSFFPAALLSSQAALAEEEEVVPLRIEITGEIEDLARQATEAFGKKDFVSARDLWGQLIKKQPINPIGWRGRADSEVDLKDFNSALKDYDEAIKLSPSASDLYIGRGLANEGLAEWQHAVDDYTKALSLLKLDPFALTFRGNAYASLGDWSNARSDYREAADLFLFMKNEGASITSRANQALATYELGDKSSALSLMQGVTRRVPGYADMHVALAAAYWANSQPRAAFKEWDFACTQISVGCRKYRDIDWVRRIRRWPPSLVTSLEDFLVVSKETNRNRASSVS